MVREVEVSVEQARRELDCELNKAEAFVPQHLTLFSLFLSNWGRYLLEGAIARYPKAAERLSRVQAEELRREFRGFQKSIPGSVRDVLAREDVWPHRIRFARAALLDSALPQKLMEKRTGTLRDAIRAIIGQVGALLIKYGLANTDELSEWEVRSDRAPLYKYPIQSCGISQFADLEIINEQYGKTLHNYISAIRRFYETREKSRKPKAGGLFMGGMGLDMPAKP